MRFMLLALALVAPPIDGAASGVAREGVAKHGFDIVIPVTEGEECICSPFSNDAAGVVKLWTCSGAGGGIAQIKVTRSGEVGAACKPDCTPIDGNACKVKVSAELIVPAGCFSGTGAIDGPGTGTTGAPCGDVVPGSSSNWVVTWDLAASCGKTDNPPGVNPRPMYFWALPCSDPRTATTANMNYTPTFQCKACAKPPKKDV